MNHTSPEFQSYSSPAKLNLFLHITGQRDNGYHELQTVFQFLDYGDTLRFSPRDDNQILLRDPIPGLAAEDDLIVKAARALHSYTNCDKGVTVEREKCLPIGAGLGGGSSNAATALVALNRLWDLQLSQTTLKRIGLKLGADVPVFVHGEACWAEGLGEQFSVVDLAEPWYLVLIPNVQVSTAELFAAPDLTRNCSPITIRDFLDGAGGNVFEPLVRARYPAVDTVFSWLETHALFSPALSGTGGCVFVRCENQEEALNLLDGAREDRAAGEGVLGFAAIGRNRSTLYREHE